MKECDEGTANYSGRNPCDRSTMNAASAPCVRGLQPDIERENKNLLFNKKKGRNVTRFFLVDFIGLEKTCLVITTVNEV
jgi:hypothetical protein